MVEAMNSLAQSQSDPGTVVATPVLLSAGGRRALPRAHEGELLPARRFSELTPVRITKKIASTALTI